MALESDSAVRVDTAHVEFATVVDSALPKAVDSAPHVELAVDSVHLDEAEAAPARTVAGAVGATVTVKGVARHKRKEISTHTIRREEIRKVVATAQDPLRALPTLPGVSVASDLSVRPLVRGGDLFETGVELDGVPLLMPYHFGSIFSVFHREAIDEFELYSGVAPAQAEGMLSGVVLARSRPAPTDSFFGGADVSMLRGSAWVGVPLVKDKLGLWLSAQSLWYDWTIKRLMDLGSVLGAVPSEDVENYKASVTLPTTWDLQAGLSARMGREWLLDVGGFVTGDKYKVSEQLTVCQQNGREVPCPNTTIHYDSIGREVEDCWLGYGYGPCPKVARKTVADTLALVTLENWMGRARLSWSPDKDLTVEAVAAVQSVDWNVWFPNGRNEVYDTALGTTVVTRSPSDDVFDWVRKSTHLGLTARKRWTEAHETSLGLGWAHGEEAVETILARPLAQLIMGTTGNPLEFLGIFNEKEVLILGNNDAPQQSLDDLMNLDFRYNGTLIRNQPSGWAEHRWDPNPKTRVRVGGRFSQSIDGSFEIPNPRLQVQRQVGDKDLVGFGLALHTQSEMPFEWRMAASTPLSSEKAWLGIAEWEHTFAPGWRSTVSAWGKIYRDLASASLQSYGSLNEWGESKYQSGLVDWYRTHPQEVGMTYDSLQRKYPDYLYDPNGFYDAHASDSVVRLRAQTIVDAVPAAERAQIREWLLPKRLTYASTGEGWAGGIEASLRYQPTQGWTGLLSLEGSISRRQDHDGGIWYPFGLERPWKASWINAFRIDKKWEVSVRYAALGGNPYTPFKIGGSSVFGNSDERSQTDTVLWIGERNSGDLTAYQRLDLRLARETKLFGKPATFYYEIWNAFNDPNMILRDAKTGQFRLPQLNMPTPVIFLGCEVRI